MKDEDKTKGQIINEFVELRQRIAELEKSEISFNRAEDVLETERLILNQYFENLPILAYKTGLFRGSSHFRGCLFKPRSLH